MARDAVLATIAKGAGIALLLQLVGVGLRGLIQVTFARAMGIEAFGQYTLIIGLVLIMGTVANLGLQLALIRLRAEYEAGGQASYLRGLLLAARVLPFAIGALVAAVAGIAISTLGLGELPARALMLGMLAVPLFAYMTMNLELAKSQERLVLAFAPFHALYPGVALGLGAILIVSTGSFHATEGLFVILIGAVVAVAFQDHSLHRRASPPAVAPRRYEVRHWLGVALPLLFFASGAMILRQEGVVVLGRVQSPAEAAPFAAAMAIALLASLPISAMTAIVAPLSGKFGSTDDHDSLARVTRLGARLSAICYVPVAGAVLVFGPQILGLFGPGFDSAAGWVLALLLLGQLAEALTGPTDYLLTSTGFHRSASITWTASALAYVATTALFAALWGITGAVLAFALTTVCMRLALGVLVYQRLRIRPFVI